MDERFIFLVVKYLDDKLEGDEIQEFEKFLQNPLCQVYLHEAEFANDIINKGLEKLIAKINTNGILPPEAFLREEPEDEEEDNNNSN